MRKTELLKLVKSNSPAIKTYEFDAMLAEHGLYALRLPPYHCDINAIEYVIRKQNVSEDINVEQLFKLTKLALENITVNKWMNYCRLTEKLKKEY